MSIHQLTIEAQSVLDDLWNDDLIPFQLTAHSVEYCGHNECTIRFYDSRLYSVDVSWSDQQPFQDAIRHVILDRVRRLDGPLQGWSATKARTAEPARRLQSGALK